uniref:ShKT domain-containing protein n=1 Tax=Strongyloides venezuelensis TaxID=75913 RepID=A0A0K0FME5_STRVS
MKSILLILSFFAISIYSLGIGSDCTLHKDCDSGVCSFISSQKGYCVKKCDVSANPSQCAANGKCQTQVDSSKDTTEGCTITTKGCSIDLDCKSSSTPICNQYSLTCEAKTTITTAPTTTSSSQSSTKNTNTYLTTTKGNLIKWPKNPNNQNLCQDKVTGGLNDCFHLARFCTNLVFKPMMTEKCPKTCGFCTQGNSRGNTNTNTGDNKNSNSGKSCVDRLDSCYKYSGLCKSPVYEDFMKKNCPGTCGC